MRYSILLHPKAHDFLEKSDETLKVKIKNSLRILSTNQKKGKKLKHSEYWRIHIGDYRAIYEIDFNTNQVILLFIGHRKKVYDDFTRLL